MFCKLNRSYLLMLIFITALLFPAAAQDSDEAGPSLSPEPVVEAEPGDIPEAEDEPPVEGAGQPEAAADNPSGGRRMDEALPQQKVSTFREPLNSLPETRIEVPQRKKRDARLDKMFKNLSRDPVVEKKIEPALRQKNGLWEDTPDEGIYNVEEEGLMTLDFMLERSYNHNPSIKTLQSQLNQAKLDVIGAKSNYYPKIQFEGSMSLSSRKLLGEIDVKEGQFGSYPIVGPDVGGIGDSSLPGGGVSTSLSFPPEDYRLYDGFPQTFYQFKFVLEQPLFTWGKIPMAVEAYKNAVHAAELMVAKKKKEVRAEISIYYQTLYYLEKMRKTIRVQKEIMERLLLVTDESYKTGFIIYNDYLDVWVKGQELIVADHRIQDEYRQALIVVAARTGYQKITTDMIDFSNVDEEWFPDVLTEEQYMAYARENNIELKLLDTLKDVNALMAKIESSKSYLKPDFGLQLSLGSMGPDFPFLQRGWYGHNTQSLIGSIGFKSTLLDGGKILSNAMKKNEELNKTLYQIQMGESLVHSFIAGQLSKLELNATNLQYRTLKSESDKQLVELRKIQYETGGTEIDYLRSQIDYNTGFIDIYSEKIDLIKNYYMLILGAGLL